VEFYASASKVEGMRGRPVLGAILQAIGGAAEARKHAEHKGLLEDAKTIARIPIYAYLGMTAGEFQFEGARHTYFFHPYNVTRQNERCVEVPLAWDEIRSSPGKSVLEIGNVLSHYYKITHEVVDKYEKATGVINEDIADFSPGKKYGLIVSISTLEHVGFDEEQKDAGKVLHAFDNIRGLLSAGGKAVFTFGLGYNPNIDSLAYSGKPAWVKWGFMRRDGKNKWREAELGEAVGAKYGSPYPFANCLAIGVIEK